MFRIQTTTHFDAAHQLQNYSGPCNKLHGHRWKAVVTIEGESLNGENMLIDFRKIKEIIDKLDHSHINEVLGEKNPTAEFLANYFYNKIKNNYPEFSVNVRIYESEDSFAEYSG